MKCNIDKKIFMELQAADHFFSTGYTIIHLSGLLLRGIKP
jgi:hypothetical protein